MNTVAQLAAAGALAGLLAACGQKPETASAGQATTNSVGENPLTAPVDYLGAVAQGQQSATRTLDLAQLRQAIQNFRVTEDRLPASLQELVTAGLLREVPQAPAGMRLDYDAKTGEVRMTRP